MRLKFGGLFRNFFLSPCDFFFRFFRLDLDPELEEYTRSGVDGIPSPTKHRSGDGDFLALPFLLVSLPRGLPVLPSTILVLRDVPR